MKREELIYCFYELIRETNRYLCKRIGEGNTLLTDSPNKDCMRCYLAGDTGIEDKHIKGISIKDGKAFILADLDAIVYIKEDLELSYVKDEWMSFDCAEMYSIQTAFSILESIQQYL